MAGNVWFQYGNISGKVSLEGIDDVADLRDAIKTKLAHNLAAYDAEDLIIRAALFEDSNGSQATMFRAQDTLQSISERFRVVDTFGKNIRFFVDVLPKASAAHISPNTSFSWSDSRDYQPLCYDKSTITYELDKSHRQGFGLTQTNEILRVYARNMLHKQIEFLTEILSDGTSKAWIVGPSGTGKSTTTAIFSSHIVGTMSIVVTWISFQRDVYPTVVRLESFKKKTHTLRDQSLLFTILDEVQDKPHLVVLDGYVQNDDALNILKCCGEWLRSGTSNLARKLVVVSSMEGLRKVRPESQCRQFQVSSWTEEEYMEAIKDDNLFKSVEKYLDAGMKSKELDVGVNPEKLDGNPEALRRQQLVSSKYYFGGGFCRGVFEMPTNDLMTYFHQAISSISNPEGYFTGTVGDKSPQVINTLFGSIPNRQGFLQRVGISRYVMSELAIIAGPSVLETIWRQSPDLYNNPSVGGFIFEAKFFSMVRQSSSGCSRETFTLQTLDGDVCWERNAIYSFNPESPSLPSGSSMWLKPERWNQGGYDAIFISRPESLLRFIQVTLQTTHDFKCQYFNSTIDRLGEVFKNIEIYFIVPVDRLRTFVVPKNDHLRTCSGDVKAQLRGTSKLDKEVAKDQNCCVGWRKVAGLDWPVS